MKAIFLLFTFFAFGACAQQDPRTSMYWNQYAMFNPATSGLEFKHEGRFTYRNQFPSLSGSSVTYFGNYNTRIGKHHGIGVNFMHNNIAISSTQSAHLNYNYQIEVGHEKKISIGVAPGYIRNKIDEYSFGTVYQPASTQSHFDLNTGVAYYGKSLYGGIGITSVLNSIVHTTDGPSYLLNARHYYGHLRYKLRVTRKGTLYFEGLWQTDAVKSNLALNVKSRLWNQVWFGFGYGLQRSFTTFIGWDIKKHFNVSYNYDFSPSKLSNSVNTSHEISIGYFIKHKPTFKIITPPMGI